MSYDPGKVELFYDQADQDLEFLTLGAFTLCGGDSCSKFFGRPFLCTLRSGDILGAVEN